METSACATLHIFLLSLRDTSSPRLNLVAVKLSVNNIKSTDTSCHRRPGELTRTSKTLQKHDSPAQGKIPTSSRVAQTMPSSSMASWGATDLAALGNPSEMKRRGRKSDNAQQVMPGHHLLPGWLAQQLLPRGERGPWRQGLQQGLGRHAGLNRPRCLPGRPGCSRAPGSARGCGSTCTACSVRAWPACQTRCDVSLLSAQSSVRGQRCAVPGAQGDDRHGMVARQRAANDSFDAHKPYNPRSSIARRRHPRVPMRTSWFTESGNPDMAACKYWEHARACALAGQGQRCPAAQGGSAHV